MTKAEQKACREIARVAAEHIVDDWGEPLKDADIPDGIDDLGGLAELVSKAIKKLRFT